MGREQSARVCAAFVIDTRVDIKFEIVEKVARHLRQSWWTIGINTHGQTRDPRVVEKRSEFDVVVGVMMRDEDIAHAIERHARADRSEEHTSELQSRVDI